MKIIRPGMDIPFGDASHLLTALAATNKIVDQLNS